jgi:hypothetical protein
MPLAPYICGMSVETTIKALRRQLRDLDQQRAKVLHAIDALEGLPGATPHTGNGSAPHTRRTGGSPLIDAAITALRAATKPLPIMELVAAVQKGGFQPNRDAKKVRASLVSALLRRTDVFSKPKRATYGLVEWSEHDGK